MISMIPVIEIRGALPIAISIFNMSWLKAYILSVFGNILIIPFLMIFLESFAKFSMKYKIFATFLNWRFKKAEQNRDLIKKYGALGLMLFVAIPLPGTGAWTAIVLVYLFRLKKTVSFFMILLGVMIAGIIVLLITLGFIKIIV
jgi:uncharacterized membrane protein